MDMNERFWLGFWALIMPVLLGIVYALWDSDRRDREFDATAPVVETCVHHNVRQRVVIQE